MAAKRAAILDRRFERQVYNAVGAGGAAEGYGYTIRARAKRPAPGARGLDSMARRIEEVAAGMARRELGYRKGVDYPWRRRPDKGVRYVNAFNIKRTTRGAHPVIRVANSAASAQYVEHGNKGPRRKSWYRIPVKKSFVDKFEKRLEESKKLKKKRRPTKSKGSFIVDGRGGPELILYSPDQNTPKSYKGYAIMLRAMRLVAAEYFKR